VRAGFVPAHVGKIEIQGDEQPALGRKAHRSGTSSSSQSSALKRDDGVPLPLAGNVLQATSSIGEDLQYDDQEHRTPQRVSLHEQTMANAAALTCGNRDLIWHPVSDGR
jgi:hypothetical protein